MKYPAFLLIVFLLVSFGCTNQSQETLEQRIESISRAEMESVAELLSNDLYEGRAPGTRGGELAEVTMQGLFKLMGLDPGMEGSYFQPFVMTGFTSSQVRATASGMELGYPDDIVGTFTLEQEEVELEGDGVFVGFGVTAPRWDWDDYKDVDVKDKIVITRVNDPGFVNPELFEGATLTYYGRWTCHIEEAARRGAAGILLIHTDETAGYDWNVVKNSWSGEELFIRSDLQNNLKFRGWLRESSLRKVLNAEGIDLDELYDRSASDDFRPVDLGVHMKIRGENRFREVTSRNVVARIPGNSEKRIVLSAHTDHLGMDPSKEDDRIYNGAIDNATALSAMTMVAKVLEEYREELPYTITILACNAEESGLLGSRYYAQNTDRSSIIANINFESTPVWGESKSIMGIGARFSDLENMISGLARDHGLEYSTFSLSNQGLFYRSDQFSFARYGIPSVWISAGEDELSGARNYTEFWGKDYHTVKDEFNPRWELGGMKQTIRYALLLIDRINHLPPPQMKQDLSFPAYE